MCDRLRGALTGLLLCAGVAGAQAPTVREATMRAKPSPELARLLEEADRARVRLDSAQARYRRAQRIGEAPADTTFVEAGPVTVAVTPSVLSEREHERLRRGIERGFATLDAILGDHRFTVVDTSGWVVRGSVGRLGALKSVYLRSKGIGQWQSVALGRPLQEAEIEAYVLSQAGRNLARAIPAFAPYHVSFSMNDRRWEFAGRELSLSYANAGRLCSAGDLAQCRRVLRRVGPERGLETWFLPTDHRAVATSALSEIRNSGAEAVASWERCAAGADSACTRLVHTLPVRDPFSNSLRGTFVQHALETGPIGMVERLRADTTSDLVSLLASAARMPEDSLVAAWQRRAMSALDEASTSPASVVLSTAFWGVALLGLAVRRKPS